MTRTALTLVTTTPAARVHADPARRSPAPLYRREHVNFCPACGKTHWWLGRVSAECAFCALAMRYAEAGS